MYQKKRAASDSFTISSPRLDFSADGLALFNADWGDISHRDKDLGKTDGRLSIALKRGQEEECFGDGRLEVDWSWLYPPITQQSAQTSLPVYKYAHALAAQVDATWSVEHSAG